MNISYELKKDECIDFIMTKIENNNDYKKSIKKKLLKFWLKYIILTFMVSFILSIGRGTKVKLLYVFSLIFSVYYVKKGKGYFNQQTKQTLYRNLQVDRDSNQKISLEINHSNITYNLDTMKSTYKLSDIKYIFEDSDGILIEVLDNIYILVPSRAFDNSSKKKEFIDLIKENLNIDLTKNIDEKLIQIMEYNC